MMPKGFRNFYLPDLFMKMALVFCVALFSVLGCDDLSEVDNEFLLNSPPPEPRYTDLANGTVRDNDTGLIWLKNANAFGGPLSWDAATSAAASLSDGEHGLTDGSIDGDWRLPTNEEWEEFVDPSYFRPPLGNAQRNGQWSEGNPFTGVQTEKIPNSPIDGALYWSSSGSDVACYFGGYGSLLSGDKIEGYAHFAWPVRDGEQDAVSD